VGFFHVARAMKEAAFDTTDPTQSDGVHIANPRTACHYADTLFSGLQTLGGIPSLYSNPFTEGALAQIAAVNQEALETNHLHHLFAVAFDPVNKPGNVDSLLNQLIESDVYPSRFTTQALEQAGGGGGGGGGDDAATILTAFKADAQFGTAGLLADVETTAALNIATLDDPGFLDENFGSRGAFKREQSVAVSYSSTSFANSAGGVVGG
jgi:hypothetical protein